VTVERTGVAAGQVGPLALVGGGEWTDGCTFDRDLLDGSGADEVVVLPTGSAYENPGKLVARAVDWFAGLGVRATEVRVLTRPDALDEGHARSVRAARFVYLAGANGMHLRSVLKDTPVYTALVDTWRSGAVLAGTAAGAGVLCDPMVDARGGAFTVGLGVVANLAIIPRSNTWSHEKIHRTVELVPKGITLAAVPEATALIRGGDGSWRVAGVGAVDVWVAGRQGTLADLPRPTGSPA
jgi:cyanophycinase